MHKMFLFSETSVCIKSCTQTVVRADTVSQDWDDCEFQSACKPVVEQQNKTILKRRSVFRWLSEKVGQCEKTNKEEKPYWPAPTKEEKSIVAKLVVKFPKDVFALERQTNCSFILRLCFSTPILLSFVLDLVFL